MAMDPDAHTRIRIDRGGLEVISGPDAKEARLDPPASSPDRKGLRYSLSMLVLGKLERLAKARFAVRQLTNDDFDSWVEDEESRTALAQTVIASSEIEGEGIAAPEVLLLLEAVTQPAGHVTAELDVRQKAIRSIFEAGVWALSRDWGNYITYDFVIELHKRMFASTRPDIAGKIKESPVIIAGGGYYIETLPPAKAEEFLKSLCERTNSILLEARESTSASMLLTVAEFVSDFLAIHPFSDGNGRIARLLSTYLLERCEYHFARFYPVDSIILETRKRYYDALFYAQRNWYLESEDMTSWIDYYVETIFVQWTRSYQRVKDEAYRKKAKNGRE